MTDDVPVPVKDLGDVDEQEYTNSSCFDCINLMSFTCCAPCIPCICCSSWVQINERQEGVILQFGKYYRTIKQPGIWWVNCLGNNVTRVPTAVISADVPVQKIVDSNGNPLLVGAIVVYNVTNAYRAAIAVANYHQYIITSAQAVLKQIVQKHPYEDPHGGESLRNERNTIGKQLVDALQVRASKAGLTVLSFEFNELSYAPEIAPQMLKRQQAEAVVAARNLIVQGAVETSEHAMELFASKGYEFTQEGREKMIKDLMTVMVSERGSDRTVNVNAPVTRTYQYNSAQY